MYCTIAIVCLLLSMFLLRSSSSEMYANDEYMKWCMQEAADSGIISAPYIEQACQMNQPYLNPFIANGKLHLN